MCLIGSKLAKKSDLTIFRKNLSNSNELSRKIGPAALIFTHSVARGGGVGLRTKTSRKLIYASPLNTTPTAPNQPESNQIVQDFTGFEGDSWGIRGRLEGDSRGIRRGFEGDSKGSVGDERGIRGR